MFTKLLRNGLCCAFLALAASAHLTVQAQTAPQTQAQVRPSVVYHIDEAQLQGLRALRSLRNHLDTLPQTRITVVALADGVDMFMEGARDAKSGTQYAALVSDLKSRGVEFLICDLTLQARGISREKMILEADFTPSGVVKITELQQQGGYAYIKP